MDFFPLVLLCDVIHPAAMVISLGILILVYRSYRDDVILRAGAEGEDIALDTQAIAARIHVSIRKIIIYNFNMLYKKLNLSISS